MAGFFCLPPLPANEIRINAHAGQNFSDTESYPKQQVQTAEEYA
jgi:hypothetical protein